jgi:hypothetical protein
MDITNKKHVYWIIIFVCVLLYANTYDGQFVSDDIDTIVKSPSIGNARQYLFTPITLINSLSYLSGKLNPLPYHLFSIIFHILATLMAYEFLLLLYKRPAAFWGGMIFAVHPLHSEAVAWISGRPYSIITVMYLLCFFGYYRATETQRPFSSRAAYYIGALAGCGYFLVGQYSFFALFALLPILYDLSFRRLKNWALWLPFIIITAVRIIFLKQMVFGRIVKVAEDIGGSSTWTNPIYNMAYSVFYYAGLVFWPHKMTLYHEPPVITRTALNVELVILALLVAALPLIYKKASRVFFGLLLFVLFLIPAYSPVTISWLIAERYMYFPFLGFCMFAACGYEAFVRRFAKYRRQLAVGLCGLLAVLAVRTVIRTEDWQTPNRFWRSTVEVSLNSARARNNLADIYGQEGNTEAALKEFLRAVALKPDYADAYHNVGNTYHRLGNLQKAVEFYSKALTYNPKIAESHYNLGVIFLEAGQVDTAIQAFSEAAKLKPDDPAIAQALILAMQKKAGK